MSRFLIRQLTAEIIGNEEVSPGTFRMTLAVGSFASSVAPGRFVMIRVSSSLDPLLRRAFSIHDCENGRLMLLYKVVGRGTSWMTRRKAGDGIDLVGPLGRGFSVSSKVRHALLIAGGTGVAPFRFLIRTLREKKVRCSLFYGAGTGAEFVDLPEMGNTVDSLVLATEDGSRGEKGLVTDLFRKRFGEFSPAGGCRVYACGPRPMLHAVARIVRGSGIPCELSFESDMACGLGTCMGCVMETRHGYQRVCREGPVFSAEDLPDEMGGS